MTKGLASTLSGTAKLTGAAKAGAANCLDTKAGAANDLVENAGAAMVLAEGAYEALTNDGAAAQLAEAG
jgi:hypothetical protein